MAPSHRPATVYAPDGADESTALARTTELVVGAHPDDVELMVPGVIGECRGRDDRWVTAVVITTGAGSVRPPDEPDLAGAALAARRVAEQRAAADLGGYGALVMLGLASGDLADTAAAGRVQERLVEVLRAARPDRVYLHDLTDLHPTHVAAARLTLDALRSLDGGRQPSRVVACEGWRSLAWLDPSRRVALDVTGHEALAVELLGCFASQLGAKGYAGAAPGRRRANAVFADPHRADAAREVVYGMDLTPLVADPGLDPSTFVLALIDEFRSGVARSLGGAGIDDRAG